MISKFGEYIRIIRNKENDSLRDMAKKLEITPAFLSAMEVGRKSIPIDYAERITSIYHLSTDEKEKLLNAILETNNKVPLELSKMNESQKEVTLVFARKILSADENLIEKLRKILEDDQD